METNELRVNIGPIFKLLENCLGECWNLPKIICKWFLHLNGLRLLAALSILVSLIKIKSIKKVKSQRFRNFYLFCRVSEYSEHLLIVLIITSQKVSMTGQIQFWLSRKQVRKLIKKVNKEESKGS